jgi:type II secretory pathway component PulF
MAAEYIGRAELALGVGFWLTIGVVLFVIALLPNPWGGNLERRYGIYHVRHGVRWVARPFWRRYLHAAAGRWAHTLGMLLEAGSPLPEAMDHARSVEADPLFRRRADEWTERVRRGEALGAVLRSARGLPPALVWQVETAQNGPGLPRALREAGTLVVRQAQGRLSRLVAPLGPLLILTLGLGVSQLALALFAPLVDVILHGGI